MAKKKKNKTSKRQESTKVKENPNSVHKKSTPHEKEVNEDDSIAEVLNNALILDESTEIVVLSDIKNNNEKQMMVTPPLLTKKQEPGSKSSIEREVGDSWSKKSSTSSRNISYTSSGDSSWMERDPFEVSYSGSINYNNGNASTKATKRGNVAPGGDLRTIEDYIAMGVPRDIAEMKHPLENVWAFWYFSNDKSRSWEQNQHNVSTVDTIEDFWQIYNYVEPASQLGIGCDYALFKKGIMPDWEDYQNKYGGRWIIERGDSGRMEDMDEYWLETLFMLIGEHIQPYNYLINGAVIQTKRGKFRLAIWLKDAKDRVGITYIGEYIKRVLKISKTIEFSVHSEDQTRLGQGSRTSPSGKNKICV